MTIENIKRFFNEIIFGAFLMRFIPGFLLFISLNTIAQINASTEIVALLFIGGFSWTLGLLLEQLCFTSYRNQLAAQENMHFKEKAPLFLAHTGVAMIISCIVLYFNAGITDGRFTFHNIGQELVLFGVANLFLVTGMLMMKNRR